MLFSLTEGVDSRTESQVFALYGMTFANFSLKSGCSWANSSLCRHVFYYLLLGMVLILGSNFKYLPCMHDNCTLLLPYYYGTTGIILRPSAAHGPSPFPKTRASLLQIRPLAWRSADLPGRMAGRLLGIRSACRLLS